MSLFEMFKYLRFFNKSPVRSSDDESVHNCVKSQSLTSKSFKYGIASNTSVDRDCNGFPAMLSYKMEKILIFNILIEF